MKTLSLFIITACVFLLLDMLWLGYLGKGIYIEKLGSLLRLDGNNLNANIPAAVIVYLALVNGIVFFVIPLAQGSILKALGYGALYGFVTYATYDFTNLAVLKDWRWDIAIIDTLWGIVLCSSTSTISQWLHTYLYK